MTPFDRFVNDYKHKNVLIFGLGTQGRGVQDAKIFAQLGANVTVTDSKSAPELKSSIDQLSAYNINYVLEKHPESLLDHTDVIIRNASVPLNHPILAQARHQHIPIKMDAALFFHYAQPKLSIGVTGTRGKSTTTNLIFQTLKSANQPAILAGNASPSASLSLLQDYDPSTWYVFELSSWQLQAFHQEKTSPHFSILTNLYPDHLLDRTFDQYANDKSAIFNYQHPTDLIITNPHDLSIKKLLKSAKSQIIDYTQTVLPQSINLQLKGDHNLANAKAAYTLLTCIKVTQQSISTSFNNFTSLPFRLQLTSKINDVSFINDSTSTTPIATMVALNTYPKSHLILGGASKKLPTDDLIKVINQKAHRIYLLIGSGTSEIEPHLDPNLIAAKSANLADLVKTAFHSSKPGDSILFSPGFTSFELFQNEFDRGAKFDQIVNTISNNP